MNNSTLLVQRMNERLYKYIHENSKSNKIAQRSEIDCTCAALQMKMKMLEYCTAFILNLKQIQTSSDIQRPLTENYPITLSEKYPNDIFLFSSSLNNDGIINTNFFGMLCIAISIRDIFVHLIWELYKENLRSSESKNQNVNFTFLKNRLGNKSKLGICFNDKFNSDAFNAIRNFRNDLVHNIELGTSNDNRFASRSFRVHRHQLPNVHPDHSVDIADYAHHVYDTIRDIVENLCTVLTDDPGKCLDSSF